LTRYHLEAGIAWEHCRAPTFADTERCGSSAFCGPAESQRARAAVAKAAPWRYIRAMV